MAGDNNDTAIGAIDDAVERAFKSIGTKQFMTLYWKPLYAMSYMFICICDFVLGPTFYNVFQMFNHTSKLEIWQSVTLQNGGLYHLASGAILGIAAFPKRES